MMAMYYAAERHDMCTNIAMPYAIKDVGIILIHIYLHTYMYSF